MSYLKEVVEALVLLAHSKELTNMKPSFTNPFKRACKCDIPRKSQKILFASLSKQAYKQDMPRESQKLSFASPSERACKRQIKVMFSLTSVRTSLQMRNKSCVFSHERLSESIFCSNDQRSFVKPTYLLLLLGL
jgi:hypothetical protein